MVVRFPDARPEALFQLANLVQRSREAAQAIRRQDPSQTIPNSMFPHDPTRAGGREYFFDVGFTDPDSGSQRVLKIKVTAAASATAADLYRRAKQLAQEIIRRGTSPNLPSAANMPADLEPVLTRATRGRF